MVGGDGGSISPWGEDPEFVPTCKWCLAVLGRIFPPPPVHPQLPVIARVVADSVREHGYAEVHGVPGDQQTELRRHIRALVREETGYSCQTFATRAWWSSCATRSHNCTARNTSAKRPSE